MSKGFKESPNKLSYLAALPQKSLEDHDDRTTELVKFNFNYLTCGAKYGQSLADWSANGELLSLVEKIKDFSSKSFVELSQTMVGGSRRKPKSPIFINYRNFPPKSGFVHPPHVPQNVEWARFRLSGKRRLCGFVVPEQMHDKCHTRTGFRFDRNTFYVVFLDENHQFWLS